MEIEELIITFKKEGTKFDVNVTFPANQNAMDVIAILENIKGILNKNLLRFPRKERRDKVIADFKD